MSRHRLILERTVYAPTHTETRSLGALAGGLVPIAGLAVLASFYSGPVVGAAAVPPELSSAPVAAVPLFTAPVRPALHLTDFSRMSGDTTASAAPSTDGAGRLNWGDAQLHHHFEGQRHERWATSSPDGGHRRVRDGHWLHGGDRGVSGRHRHVDGHHADGGAQHHHDPTGRHHRSGNHVGGHHQGAHSHGGHHRG